MKIVDKMAAYNESYHSVLSEYITDIMLMQLKVWYEKSFLKFFKGVTLFSWNFLLLSCFPQNWAICFLLF